MEIFKSIVTNILIALYQPFWFAVLLTIFILFFICMHIIRSTPERESKPSAYHFSVHTHLCIFLLQSHSMALMPLCLRANLCSPVYIAIMYRGSIGNNTPIKGLSHSCEGLKIRAIMYRLRLFFDLVLKVECSTFRSGRVFL
mgnify:CR=1 FL=1